MADLLGAGFELVEIHKLYECLDRLLEHKQALFDHLTQRWQDLFNAKFDVLLFDLTSTYFESDPPFAEDDKRKYGYSRDKRFDCVQVVIALIVTPEGFPLAYEVMAGNTADNTTLHGFLKKIEAQYGKAERIWVMDRGIPTEEVLREMRISDPPVSYLVGTPRGRLGRYEKALTDLPWHKVRDGVEVKLLPQDKEVYVLAQSQDRIHKERSMRRRQLKRYGSDCISCRAWNSPGISCCSSWGQLVSNRLRLGGLCRSIFPERMNLCDSLYARTACERFVAGRDGISCERTWLAVIRPKCGSSIPSWSTSKKRSKILKGTWHSGRSITRRKHASKRISSWPSWPIPCR